MGIQDFHWFGRASSEWEFEFYEPRNSCNSVAIGNQAGSVGQKAQSVAIGFETAFNQQGTRSIAIGPQSAILQQGDDSVVIGSSSAVKTASRVRSIVIGHNNILSPNLIGKDAIASPNLIGKDAIAIGNGIGIGSASSVGTHSIVIGKGAVCSNTGSIVLGNTNSSTSFVLVLEATFWKLHWQQTLQQEILWQHTCQLFSNGTTYYLELYTTVDFLFKYKKNSKAR